MVQPLTFTQVHPLFAAHVDGLDSSQAIDAVTAKSLRDALERYSLLVLRKFWASEAYQLSMARVFGVLEGIRSGLSDTNGLIVLTNVGPDGQVLPESDLQAANTRANRLWHSDSSFREYPALASVLAAPVVPTRGGETEFAGMRAAWTALPKALKYQATGRVAIHDLAHSRAAVDAALAKGVDCQQLPPVRQALVRRHRPSGEAGLFLGSHIRAIEGLSDAKAHGLLVELTEFATQASFVYTHCWAPGDLLIWDNRFTLHRGRPFPPAEPRRLVRATVAGQASSLNDMI